MRATRLLDFAERYATIAMAAFAALGAAYVAVRYANQPLLDMYFFRQTQTALTSFWFVKEGFKLDYITPVAGAPWAIPFEFPIYQALVALIVKITGAPMDAVGRLLSFAFLLACLHPARQIAQRLDFAPRTVSIFAALVLSSPLYLYWGRTFMIETAAVYFAFAALPYFIDILKHGLKTRAVLLFAAFMALGMLQKITTALPVIGFAGALWAVHLFKAGGWTTLIQPRVICGGAIAFLAPLAIGAAWAVHADQVKTLNAFGQYLTSDALSAWNWGTTAQRFSPQLYLDVIARRMLVHNAGSFIGVAILIVGLLPAAPLNARRAVLAGLTLAFAPLFVFTNLHLQHEYYQTSCTIFLIGALAVSAGEALPKITARRGAVPAAAALVMISNLVWFKDNNYYYARAEYPEAKNQFMAVGMALRRNVPEDRAFVAFGNDWNSSFAYIAQRKSFTAPAWFPQYEQVWAQPQTYLGDTPLAALAACPENAETLDGDAKTAEHVQAFLESHPGWCATDVMQCRILTPGPFTPSPVLASHTICPKNGETADE